MRSRERSFIFLAGARTLTHLHTRTFSYLTSLPSNVFIKIPPFVTFHLVLPPNIHPTNQHGLLSVLVFFIHWLQREKEHTKCVFRWQATALFWLFSHWFALSLCAFVFGFLSSHENVKRKIHRTWIFTRFNFVPIKCLWNLVSFHFFFRCWWAWTVSIALCSGRANERMAITFENLFNLGIFFCSLNLINLFGFLAYYSFGWREIWFNFL